jgi:hypothetical protein
LESKVDQLDRFNDASLWVAHDLLAVTTPDLTHLVEEPLSLCHSLDNALRIHLPEPATLLLGAIALIAGLAVTLAPLPVGCIQAKGDLSTY